MPTTGHASTVAFDAPLVVVVDQTPETRLALTVATAVLPVGLLIGYLATDDTGPWAGAHGPTKLLAAIAALVALTGAWAVFKGTVRARLLVGNQVVDTVGWSLRPPRRLRAKVGEHAVEAEIGGGAERSVTFEVDGAKLAAIELV